MLYEEGVATCSFLQLSVSGLSLIRAVAIEGERDVSDLFQRIAKTQGCFPRSRALHGEYLFTRKAAIEGRSWRSWEISPATSCIRPLVPRHLILNTCSLTVSKKYSSSTLRARFTIAANCRRNCATNHLRTRCTWSNAKQRRPFLTVSWTLSTSKNIWKFAFLRVTSICKNFQLPSNNNNNRINNNSRPDKFVYLPCDSTRCKYLFSLYRWIEQWLICTRFLYDLQFLV